VSTKHIPSVEHRFYTIEQALAMGTMLCRALGHSDGELFMSRREKASGFARVADVLQEAQDALFACTKVLSADAISQDAPDVREVR
jgi:hypothetical protein